MNYKRKKRLVEIYFILYLSALLFLLPDGKNVNKDGTGTGIQIYQPSFVLLPEKNTLICRVALDSTGPKVISLDSINTVFYTGDVEDVFFEFIVEDQSLNNSIKLTSNAKPESKFFRFEQNDKRHAAIFKWEPPLQEVSSKTFVVKVIATAKKRTPDKTINAQKSTENASKTVKYSTQFSLLLIYLNAPGGNPVFSQNIYTSPLNDTAYQFTLPFQNIVPQLPTGKINMFALYSDIKQIAGQRWTNYINVSNANLLKDLTPEGVRIKYSPRNTGGKAEIYNIKDGQITLRGLTPSHGRMKVEVSITRKYDGEEKTVTFNVSPQPFEEPDYQKIVYPEIVYEIKPNLPPDIGKNVYALIRDENNNIRARSQKGETFTFSPNTLDVNKVFYLERYIDNVLFGEKYPISVMNYPKPKIVDIQSKSNNEAEVITRAYGIKDKTRNEIEKFIVEGNAVYQDLRGKITKKHEKSYPVTIQYFRFKRKDPNKPFSFKIIAVDRIGNKSQAKFLR
jgi:hypothetical protein